MMRQKIATLAFLALVAVATTMDVPVASAQSLGGPASPDPSWISNLIAGDLLDPPATAGLSLDGVGQRLDLGPVGFGVSVSPRRSSLRLDAGRDGAAATSPAYRLGDTELRTTEIGLDLKLRWPTAVAGGEAAPLRSLQPYVSLGPAVFVASNDETHALVRPLSRPDLSMSLGIRGALGLIWQMTKDASLFGEYRLTQDRAPGGRAATDLGVDLLYGFSLRF